MNISMLWRLCLAVVSVCVTHATAISTSFKQTDYKFTPERLEVVTYNPDYVSNLTIKNFKYNRTQAVCNITMGLKKNLNANVKIQIQAYKFMSNEYRYFPILFSFNFCQAIRNNDFGVGRLFECGNLTRSCPFTKGIYFICNFAPDGDKFPPFIPEGSYMIDLKWFDGPTEILFNQGYSSIKTKNKWDMK